jgi:hypothetical protein
MKNFILAACSVVLLLLSACDDAHEIKWNTIDRPNYTMRIPDSMVEDNQLNDEANLQYASLADETYVIVIEESARDFETIFADTSLGYQPNLLGYTQLMYDDFKETADSLLVAVSPKIVKVDGDKERYTFNGQSKFEQSEIYYIYGTIKSDSSYYQVIAWTMANKKEMNANLLQDMVNSLTIK